MPVFYEKLAEMEDPPALPRLRLWISAGAPLLARAGEAFSKKLLRKVHTFYGSSECGGIAYDDGEEPAYEEGFLGQAMRNVEIAPLAELEDGEHEIAVRSAAVGDGYYPDPEPELLGGGDLCRGTLCEWGRGLYLRDGHRT